MRLWLSLSRRLQGLNRCSRLAVAVSFFAMGALVPCGAHSQAAGYWHTSAEHILDSQDRPVHIRGISWYGFETTNGVVGGLYTQDYKVVLSTLKKQGFNAIRLPFSGQMVETPSVAPNIAFDSRQGPINSDLHGLNSLEVLDKIVRYASRIGLRIIFDHHRMESGNTAESSGLWYSNEYPESSWIADWVTLAYRYRGDPTVVGFDLHNEPHSTPSGGACWDCGGPSDWHLAAERAGNVILDANPDLLILVEGVDTYQGDSYWWGGNLEGVANSPVVLGSAGHLVYSAHDYGPREQAQRWFSAATTSASLEEVWTRHWAYISQNHIAPVYLGEFGTSNVVREMQDGTPGSQGQWFSTLVSFLNQDKDLNWSYWAVNGEDRYGLFADNYLPGSLNTSKIALLETGHTREPFFSFSRATSSLLASAAHASLLGWLVIAGSGMTFGLVVAGRFDKQEEGDEQESA